MHTQYINREKDIFSISQILISGFVIGCFAFFVFLSSAQAQFKAAKDRSQIRSSELVGVASAVHGAVELSYGQEKQSLQSGDQIYLNDRIKTGGEGSVVLLLKDQSSFSLGKNSQFVIDEFIYRPSDPSVSTLGTNLITGFARYVSGAVSKANKDGVKMRTPVGTIGIRGSVVTAKVTDDGEPELTVSNRGARRGNPSGANESRAIVTDESGQETEVPVGKVGIFRTRTPGVFALVSLSDIPAFSSVFVTNNGNIILGDADSANLIDNQNLVSELILNPSQLAQIQDLLIQSQTIAQQTGQTQGGSDPQSQLTKLLDQIGVNLQTSRPQRSTVPEIPDIPDDGPDAE